MAIRQTLAVASGLLGNVIGFITFLAPLPTFYQIYKKKSTQGFQSIPYIVALSSASFFTYYGFIKMDPLLIAANGIGCTIESIYIIVYLCYATKEARILTMILVFLMNILGYGMVLLLTLLLTQGAHRQGVIGWICMAFSLCVFVAPLCIVRKVIKTKSVEYMPFPLSFFLTLGGVAWSFYGIINSDYYIAVPNILGIAFGVLQMVLYAIYKNNNRGENDEESGGGVPSKGSAEDVEMMKHKLDRETKDDVVVVEDNNNDS